MEKYAAQVIKRPEEISGDTAKSEDALKHVIVEVQKIIPPRLIALVFANTSFVARDIDCAINKIISENADSLFSGRI